MKARKVAILIVLVVVAGTFYSLDLGSKLSIFLFASFEDRLTWAWPDGFNLVIQHGSTILGRGIGGIGAAQKYYEPELYAFADNLYLYIYGALGVLVLPIIGYYTLIISRLDIARSPWQRLIWFWAIAVLMSGWATNGIEGAFTSILLGLTLAYAYRNHVGIRDRRKDLEGCLRLQWNKNFVIANKANPNRFSST